MSSCYTQVDPGGSYMTAGHYVIAWLERPHRDIHQAAKWFALGRAKNYAPWRIWSEHDVNDGGAQPLPQPSLRLRCRISTCTPVHTAMPIAVAHTSMLA